MSGIFKILLLLAVMVCISKAQSTDAAQRCLCLAHMKAIVLAPAVKEIQVHPATNFCNKVEIVVTNKNGLRYCLDPEADRVKKLLGIISKKSGSLKSGNSPAWCKI